MRNKVDTVDRVRRALSRREGVVEKRMVGGLSFILKGSMCCGVTGDALMIRTGPEALEEALARPHVRPMTLGGRRLAGFVCVEPAGFRTDAALNAWIGQSLDYVMGLPDNSGAPPPSKRRRAMPAGGIEARFDDLVSTFSGKLGVTLGSGKRGFGSRALCVDGRIFAMITRGKLVVKLPAKRIADLRAAGHGRPFDAGKGRPMKEWVVVAPASRRWRVLAEEARAFVATSSPGPSPDRGPSQGSRGKRSRRGAKTS